MTTSHLYSPDADHILKGHSQRPIPLAYPKNKGSRLRLWSRLGPANFRVARRSGTTRHSVAARSGVRERSSAARAASGRPWRNSQRGDSDTMKLPSTNRIPGGSEAQKIRRHAWSSKAKTVAALVDAVTSATR